MRLDAAEQVFKRADGGCSSLLWLDHPTRPVILMLHDYGLWRGWPDEWVGQHVDGEEVPVGHVDTDQGFGYLVRQANLTPRIGHAIREEQSYRAEVEELEGGWRLTDSYGRLLELKAMPSHWCVVGWPDG